MADPMLRGVLRLLVRLTLKPALGAGVPVPLQRALLKSAAPLTRLTRGVRIEAVRAGGVPCERLTPAVAAPQAVILYLHGGGYCIGSPVSHRPITTALSAAAGITVLAPDYRLAPEHPYPAALDDALAAYRELVAGPGSVIVAGDSAGGGLAVALALAARQQGLPAPAGMVLLSPWVDLACGGASMRSRAARDPMLTAGGLRRWGRLYAGENLEHPLCSPLNADLAGLPPALIQVGTEEVLHDDAVRLGQRLAAAGVEAQLEHCEGMWHDFHMHARVLDAADRAVAALAHFARGLSGAHSGNLPADAAQNGVAARGSIGS